MKKNAKIIIVATALATVLVCIPLKLYAGKSIRFLLDSGFRAPFSAKVVESGNRAIGRDGEWVYVFEADSDTIKSYLSKPPWKNTQWTKDPVPSSILSWPDEIASYKSSLSESDVWHMYQQPIRRRHDEGRLIVIDAPKRRVYFLGGGNPTSGLPETARNLARLIWPDESIECRFV